MRTAFRPHRPRLLLAGAAILGTAMLLVPRSGPAPAPTPAPAVISPVAAPAPAIVPAAPAPVAAGTAGLQLRGVLGYRGSPGAAIFALPDGRQRLVAVGREVTPGVRLERIAGDRVTVHDGVQRLEFVLPELRDVGAAAPAPAPAPVAAAAPVVPADLADVRRALEPQGDAGHPRGYRIAGTAPQPLLDRAGLRPGDIVLAVDGRPLDEARLRELPTELLGATVIEIDYERGGRRLRATVPTRP